MANVTSVLKTGCLVLAGIAGMLVVAIVLLAAFGKKPAPWEQRLAALPASERATLDEVTKVAGIAITDLRDVGQGAPLDDERNFRAIAIEDGHVRMFSLQRSTPPLPSLSAWTAMETLSLRGAGLAEIPDLSGCAHLDELDVSKNQITAVKASLLPLSLKTLDISENPLSDLAPLAVLPAAREIHARHTNVTAFNELLDLPLSLLDLRDNQITRMPERFPKSADFRVDVEGCPVSSPHGYLSHWSFSIREQGVVGGTETQEGVVSSGKFEVKGSWKVVPHRTTISLSTPQNILDRFGPVELELGVEHGRLRVFLPEAEESRGPWFQKGFVKGAGGFFHTAAMLYADAEPGKPARLHGILERVNYQPCYFYIEPLPGEPVQGLTYRVWRN